MRVGILLLGLLAALPAKAADFHDWAAVVVAGDWRAHNEKPTEVFDNARHDIAGALVRMGFAPRNVVQFSVRPQRYPQDQPEASDSATIADTLWDLSNRTKGGCLAYFTSHGSTDGIALGDDLLTPKSMRQMINNACGDRPTVVVVAACFSGVFVPALAAANRLVLTAARPDRTSFGCGEQDRYTFFDACMLQALPGAGDFPNLAKDVQGCVASHETKEGIRYRSEPQLSIGPDVVALLPRWR